MYVDVFGPGAQRSHLSEELAAKQMSSPAVIEKLPESYMSVLRAIPARKSTGRKFPRVWLGVCGGGVTIIFSSSGGPRCLLTSMSTWKNFAVHGDHGPTLVNLRSCR